MIEVVGELFSGGQCDGSVLLVSFMSGLFYLYIN